MPRTFEFELSDTRERTAILEVVLGEELLGDDVKLTGLADLTENYSGSDLQELCRYAAMIPIREALRNQRLQSHVGVVFPSHPLSNLIRFVVAGGRPGKVSEFCLAASPD
jgi:SpoVK/Ycf46/Vps4 family AAA+-type ATPase